MSKFKTTEQFISDAIKVHGDKYSYKNTVYIGVKNKVIITCDIHGDFLQVPNYHLSGNGCNDCGRDKLAETFKKTKEEFVNSAKKIHGDKYGYENVKYKNNKTKVDVLCKKHNQIFSVKPENHINQNKTGCPLCKGEKHGDCSRKSLDLFIKEAIEIHGDKYTYDKVLYKNGHIKVSIKCNVKGHGYFNQEPSTHIHQKSGCPICKESKGEKMIANILTDNGIKFIREYKFDNCKNVFKLPFDFYLPNQNTCIEYDGRQHYEETYFGGVKGFLLVSKNDKIKNDYCNFNNITLIRIPYTMKTDEVIKFVKDRLLEDK